MVIALLIAAGCGHPAAPQKNAAPVAQEAAQEAAPDAAPDAEPVRLLCCADDHWICASAPPQPDPCAPKASGSGGCCQAGTWTCNRLPRAGECPGAGVPGVP